MAAINSALKNLAKAGAARSFQVRMFSVTNGRAMEQGLMSAQRRAFQTSQKLQMIQPTEKAQFKETDSKKSSMAIELESMPKSELLDIFSRLPVSNINAIAAERKAEALEERYPTFGRLLAHRTRVMLEVTVSKIFPAGFGWQAASVVAGNAGYEATSPVFWTITGLGDGIGVVCGHTAFMALKKACGFDVNLLKEAQAGTLLGSAAFCSGFTWQPALNVLVDMGMSFNQCVTGVFAACTGAFFIGLRGFRTLYSPYMSGIEANNAQNFHADAWLSVAIGGATGCFVGTDVSFGSANWLRPIVGIEEGASDMMGQVLAGSSTALGFCAVQSAENVVMAKGHNWVD